MKALCALLAAIFLLALSGCGGSDDSATSAETSAEREAAGKPASVERKARYPVPQLPSQRDPLEKLIVKDVKVGEGPVANWGDKAVVRYVGVYYDTGKSYSEHWESSWTFKLDGEQIGPGWQKGIHGMQVGDRREIFIPARLIFEGADGDIAYVVELLKVKPGGKGEKPSHRTTESSAGSYRQEGFFAAITLRGEKGNRTSHPLTDRRRKSSSSEISRKARVRLPIAAMSWTSHTTAPSTRPVSSGTADRRSPFNSAPVDWEKRSKGASRG